MFVSPERLAEMRAPGGDPRYRGGLFGQMGLGQFGRGGGMPWQPQQPDPNLHGPWEGPPITGGGFDRAAYDQRYQRGLIPGSPGYEASVQQNPGIDPQTGRPWQAITENWGGTKPQGIPGGYGGAPMPPMGQGPMPPMANTPFSYPGGQVPGQYGQPPGTGQMGAFNPTQQRHNAWVTQHGGMAPLSQYSQFGQGGGWGNMLGGLGSAFGLRR